MFHVSRHLPRLVMVMVLAVTGSVEDIGDALTERREIGEPPGLAIASSEVGEHTGQHLRYEWDFDADGRSLTVSVHFQQ